jgi:DNA-binding transcriptional MerR regulator
MTEELKNSISLILNSDKDNSDTIIENNTEFITASEISRLTGVTNQKLYRWKYQGFLKSVGKDTRNNVLYDLPQLNRIQTMLGLPLTTESEYNDIVSNTLQNKYYTIGDLSKKFKISRDNIVILENQGRLPKSERHPRFNRIWLKEDIDKLTLPL